MKTVTVRQLRHDSGSVFAWVEQGETVCISRPGKPIAWLTPPPAPLPGKPRKRPDSAARLKRIYGDLVLSGDTVVDERRSRPY